MTFHQYGLVHGATFNIAAGGDEELSDFAEIRTCYTESDGLKMAQEYKKSDGSGMICLVYRDSASGSWRRILDYDETEKCWR